MENKIALVYFSGTNVTHSYAEVLQAAILEGGWVVESINVTPYDTRQVPLPIDAFDAFIFGFPVYGDFAPSVINMWLPTLDGQGKPCGMFFTYGARTTGYAHFHTKSLLEQAGFRVVLSAEFLGRHSFNVAGWRILPERPDQQDFDVARGYVKIALEKFSQEDPPQLELQMPFGYDSKIYWLERTQKSGDRGPTHPVRIEAVCSMCRDCESECPTQSFNADLGLSDPERCIECMRCVYICPDQVIRVDERMEAAYEDFKTHLHLTEAMMAAKMSKIITESWQAAA
jgi:NAD-dependent dihydropyrimidine dehydrogenase PreA subunit